MSSSPPHVLLTGATGYVGGTILHQLATSTDPSLERLTITCLVRGADRASTLDARYNNSSSSPNNKNRIRTVLCSDFSQDLPLLREEASRHDIVINAATGFHPSSAIALVEGLAEGEGEGEEKGGGEAWMIHTSGCSNIADQPLTGESRPDKEWVDGLDSTDVYDFEKSEEERQPYPQRTSELGVLDASLQTGGGEGKKLGKRKVNATSIQIANMIGEGEGLFQKASLILPIMMGFVASHGYGFYLGDGTGCIDWVHISDVAGLYVLLVKKIVSGDDGKENIIPRGKSGIIFPTFPGGRTLLKDYATVAVDVCFESGVLPLKDGPKGKEVRNLDLDEAAKTTAGNKHVAEVGWSAHRMTRGMVAREKLGWQPRFVSTEEDWKGDFWNELRAMREGRRGVTIDNCINEG